LHPASRHFCSPLGVKIEAENTKEKGMINTFAIRRALIETALDQPSCPFSSFFIYPSNFSPCLGFLAKNKSADAKRGFRDGLEVQIELALVA